MQCEVVKLLTGFYRCTVYFGCDLDVRYKVVAYSVKCPLNSMQIHFRVTV